MERKIVLEMPVTKRIIEYRLTVVSMIPMSLSLKKCVADVAEETGKVKIRPPFR